jgi:hypothetical protein
LRYTELAFEFPEAAISDSHGSGIVNSCDPTISEQIVEQQCRQPAGQMRLALAPIHTRACKRRARFIVFRIQSDIAQPSASSLG